MLINPPWISKKETRLLKLHSLTPPLGLCYIAAVLEKNSIDVEILDAAVLNLTVEETVEHVTKKNSDVVGITATTPLAFSAIETLKKIKTALPKTITVFGGPHINAIPYETMKSYPFIDIGVLGEGEYAMLDIASGVPLKKIRGIIYRKEKEIIVNEKREFIKNLDSLPFPARHLLPDLKFYKLSPSDYERLPVTTMITSRGCPFNCIFCNKQVFGRFYRSMSAERVIDEIKHLMKNYGIKEVKIWDDIFTLEKERTEKICDIIIKEKMDITWSCESRVDLVTKSMLLKMKKAGCWCIDYGIESASQKILDFARKGITISQIEKAIKWTKEVGIKVRGYFVIGLPGDTERTIRKTIDFSKKLDLDYVTFFIMTPFPGTDLYSLAEKLGHVTSKNWRDYYTLSEKKVVFVPKGISKEKLERLYTQAYHEFYFRPSYILKTILSIRSMRDVKRIVSGGLTFLLS